MTYPEQILIYPKGPEAPELKHLALGFRGLGFSV